MHPALPARFKTGGEPAPCAPIGVGTSRANYVAAYAKAEAMRRVVETRRADIIKEHEKAEAKQLDEMATLLFARE